MGLAGIPFFFFFFLLIDGFRTLTRREMGWGAQGLLLSGADSNDGKASIKELSPALGTGERRRVSTLGLHWNFDLPKPFAVGLKDPRGWVSPKRTQRHSIGAILGP